MNEKTAKERSEEVGIIKTEPNLNYLRQKNGTFKHKGKKIKLRVYIRSLAVNIAELTDEPMLSIRKQLIEAWNLGGFKTVHVLYLKMIKDFQDNLKQEENVS